MCHFHHLAQLIRLLFLLLNAHWRRIILGCGHLGLLSGAIRGMTFVRLGARSFIRRRPCGILLLNLCKHIDGLPVKLLIAFDHEPFEREKVIDGHDLVNDFLVDRVLAGFVTSSDELFVADTQLCHKLSEQVLHDLLKVHMDFSEL